MGISEELGKGKGNAAWRRALKSDSPRLVCTQQRADQCESERRCRHLAIGGSPVRLDVGTNAAVSDPDPFGFEVIRVGAGLSGGPLFTVVADGSGRMYVAEKGDTIRVLDPHTGVADPTPFLSVAGQVLLDGEQGLLASRSRREANLSTFAQPACKNSIRQLTQRRLNERPSWG